MSRRAFSAEAALRESELRYRLLFEQNAAGVCVTEATGAIVDCNLTFSTMLGYARSELIGRDAGELYVRRTERTDILSLLSDSPTLNSVEVELTKKDGQKIWVLTNLTLVGNRTTLPSSTSAIESAPRNRSSFTPTTTF